MAKGLGGGGMGSANPGSGGNKGLGGSGYGGAAHGSGINIGDVIDAINNLNTPIGGHSGLTQADVDAVVGGVKPAAAPKPQMAKPPQKRPLDYNDPWKAQLAAALGRVFDMPIEPGTGMVAGIETYNDALDLADSIPGVDSSGKYNTWEAFKDFALPGMKLVSKPVSTDILGRLLGVNIPIGPPVKGALSYGYGLYKDSQMLDEFMNMMSPVEPGYADMMAGWAEANQAAVDSMLGNTPEAIGLNQANEPAPIQSGLSPELLSQNQNQNQSQRVSQAAPRRTQQAPPRSTKPRSGSGWGSTKFGDSPIKPVKPVGDSEWNWVEFLSEINPYGG